MMETGTTNWQRFFAALMIPEKEPEDFIVPDVFKMIPRVKTSKLDTDLKVHKILSA